MPLGPTYTSAAAGCSGEPSRSGGIGVRESPLIMIGMSLDVEAMAVPETTPQKRWITLIEVLLGAFIVIGHNVYHVVPNEVPFLFVLFWISPRLLRGKWDLS